MRHSVCLLHPLSAVCITGLIAPRQAHNIAYTWQAQLQAARPQAGDAWGQAWQAERCACMLTCCPVLHWLLIFPATILGSGGVDFQLACSSTLLSAIERQDSTAPARQYCVLALGVMAWASCWVATTAGGASGGVPGVTALRCPPDASPCSFFTAGSPSPSAAEAGLCKEAGACCSS